MVPYFLYKKGIEARSTFAPQDMGGAGKGIQHPSRGVFYTEERNLGAKVTCSRPHSWEMEELGPRVRAVWPQSQLFKGPVSVEIIQSSVTWHVFN